MHIIVIIMYTLTSNDGYSLSSLADHFFFLFFLSPKSGYTRLPECYCPLTACFPYSVFFYYFLVFLAYYEVAKFFSSDDLLQRCQELQIKVNVPSYTIKNWSVENCGRQHVTSALIFKFHILSFKTLSIANYPSVAIS